MKSYYIERPFLKKTLYIPNILIVTELEEIDEFDIEYFPTRLKDFSEGWRKDLESAFSLLEDMAINEIDVLDSMVKDFCDRCFVKKKTQSEVIVSFFILRLYSNLEDSLLMVITKINL